MGHIIKLEENMGSTFNIHEHIQHCSKPQQGAGSINKNML